jgi:hypothetical protein
MRTMSTGQNRDRRAEERSHLVRFLESLPGAPAGTRDFGDKPDLVIHTATHRIRVEHTQVLRLEGALGKPFPKEAESLEQRSVERAQQLFEERGGPALFVYVYFNELPIRKADVAGIAERLAAVVPRIAPADPGAWTEVESWSYNRTAPGALPEQVEELYVIRPPPSRRGESVGCWSLRGGSRSHAGADPGSDRREGREAAGVPEPVRRGVAAAGGTRVFTRHRSPAP